MSFIIREGEYSLPDKWHVVGGVTNDSEEEEEYY